MTKIQLFFIPVIPAFSLGSQLAASKAFARGVKDAVSALNPKTLQDYEALIVQLKQRVDLLETNPARMIPPGAQLLLNYPASPVSKQT